MPSKNKKGAGLIIPSESVEKLDTEDLEIDTEDDEIVEKKLNRLQKKIKEEKEDDEDYEEDEELESEEIEEEEEEEEEENKPKTKVITSKDETCFYDYAEQKEEEDDLEYDDGIEDEDIEIKNKYITGDERISKPFLTKYERVRVLGTRTQQLLGGAKPMLKNFEKLTPKEMARTELEKGVLPLIIHRPMPNGLIEVWKVNELKIVN